MDRFRSNVNNSVYYDDEGRLFHRGGNNSFPGFTAVKDTRSDPYYHSYDPYREQSRPVRILSKFFRRGSGRQYQSSPNTPIATRRLDDHRSVPALTYKTESRPSDYYYAGAGPTVVRTAYSDPFPRTRDVAPEAITDYDRRDLITADNSYRSTTVVEERIIPTEKPTLWWLFVLVGILLIGTGILQIMFCIDFHWYSRIWAGILMILFGVMGAVHNGDYKSLWKNWTYIILGFVTTAAIFCCAALTLITVGHNTMQLTEYTASEWTSQEQLYWIADRDPQVRLSSNNLVTNIWLCYGIDWVVLVLLLIGMLVMTSTIQVFNHYYDANYEFVRVVQPFSEPCLFNPYGQVSMGQAIIFWGMIQRSTVHGNDQIRWQNIWAPVWSGIIPVIAGFFAAVALKRIDGKHKLLGFIAMILEFLSFAGIIVSIVITSVGMYDNVQVLGSSSVMNITNYSKQLLTASIILFCIGLIVCLAGIMYSVALLVRLLITMCCDNSSYGGEDSRENIYPSREKLSSNGVSYRSEEKFYNARM